MHSPTTESDSDWDELASILDASMDQLQETDRDALVLRFFERHDFRAIGTALGVSDDTAQKRVSRALEKLRTLLLQRKSTVVPLAALAAALETSSVQSAPAQLAARVSENVLNGAVAAQTGAASAGITGLALASWLKVLVGTAAAIVVASLVVLPRLQPRVDTASVQGEQAEPGLAATAGSRDQTAATNRANEPLQAAAIAPDLDDSNSLRLLIVAADSGKPVPNVPISCRGWEGEKFQGKTLQSDRAGICRVPVSRATTTLLELTSRSEGFADTRLKWEPANGQKIPPVYTLRLARAEAIGGSVVDENDQPLAGATVGFNHEDDPVMVKDVETHEFGWIQVTTDSEGHWTLNRIAPEVLRRIYGSAHHPEHVESAMVFASRDEEALKQIRAGKYVFHVSKAVTVRGYVVSADGDPVENANLLAGKRSMSDSRSAKSTSDGSFEITGCRPGKSVLTAEAKGYSATTIDAEFKEDAGPFRIVLQRGAVLLVRVLSTTGTAVPNATFYLDTMRHRPINSPDYNTTAVQADFHRKTDSEGLLVWSNAPDRELDFDIAAGGYMRSHQVNLRPDGTEHTVTLNPALVVSGTVRDADSGDPIPAFRLVTGFPMNSFNPDPDNPGQVITTMTPNFPMIDRYWASYGDGKFRRTIEEPALYDKTNPGFVFKIEAEGYAPYISRAIAADEGQVQLDVILKKAQTGQITILLPDGTPAALAEIAYVKPGARPELTPSGFARMNQGDPSAVLRADDAGQVKFTADPAIQQIVVAHASGYAEATPSALLDNPILTLQPWGRLEGTWTVGGKPASGRKLLPQFAQEHTGGVSFDFLTFQTLTDADGHYVFNHVPPGKLKLIYLAFTPPNSFAHLPLNNSEVEIRPGETATKDLGGEGYVVTTHLVWPDGIKPDKDWRCFGSIGTVPPPALRDALNDAQKLEALKDSPEVADYARSAKNWQLQTQDLYTMTGEEIPPGEYVIVINAFQQGANGAPSMNLMGSSAVITIPSQPSTGSFDAGTIQLQVQQFAQTQK